MCVSRSEVMQSRGSSICFPFLVFMTGIPQERAATEYLVSVVIATVRATLDATRNGTSLVTIEGRCFLFALLGELKAVLFSGLGWEMAMAIQRSK